MKARISLPFFLICILVLIGNTAAAYPQEGTMTSIGSNDSDVNTSQAGTTSIISVSSNNIQGNAFSGTPSISAEGQYVAFASSADNLISNDNNNSSDIFVRDRLTNNTSIVSISSNGNLGDGGSFSPSISPDGRFVAFSSYSSNLTVEDNNERGDIFVHDRLTSGTTMISVASNGTQSNGYSGSPSISDDGRYVAFQSEADNLITGDTNGASDIFVHDRLTDTTNRISVSSTGTQANDSSQGASISGDGRYVVFQSIASNLVSGDNNGVQDIFVHDRQTNVTTSVSTSSSGVQGNDFSDLPTISADGRFVAFMSTSSNLVGNNNNNNSYNIFVKDRQTNIISKISVAYNGLEANGGSFGPDISADGRYLTFASTASNLVNNDNNNTWDTFLYDRQTGTMSLVSISSDGLQGYHDPFAGSPSSVSSDGRHVAFQSDADNFVDSDNNNTFDVFVRDIYGTVNTNAITINQVNSEHPLEGRYLEGIPVINQIKAKVDWGGNSPKHVVFKLNGRSYDIETQNTQAVFTINMGEDLLPGTNTFQITAISQNGQTSATQTFRFFSIPTPLWIAALQNLGVLSLPVLASGDFEGQASYSMGFSLPNEPFKVRALNFGIPDTETSANWFFEGKLQVPLTCSTPFKGKLQ